MSRRVPVALARRVRERARDACEYCLLPQEWQESEFHIDHILPRVVRGRSILENLALACVGCSLHKQATLEGVDSVTKQVVRLFHPRRDVWREHFTWDGRWRIVGLTPIGRVTIVALQLNRSRLVAVRSDLASVSRYPPLISR